MFDASALPPQTLEVLTKLVPFVSDYYLAGGTAIAIFYGHRISEDMDFFSPERVNALEISSELRHSGFKLEDISIAPGTLHCLINGVRTSFMEYGHNLLQDLQSFMGIKVASVVDIACMKLSAVVSRAEKKDYYDIAEILTHKTLRELLQSFLKKYGPEIDTYSLLKSLCYFEDIEGFPEPSGAQKTWNQVKHILVEACRNYLEEL